MDVSGYLYTLATATALSISALLLSGEVIAKDTSECIESRVSFDGTDPLVYATVLGDAGAKVHLHAEYPAQCNSSDPRSCEATAYVLPGDRMAVGKTCGNWVYGQYVGQKRVTTGWVASRQLSSGPAASNTRAAADSTSGRRYHFALTAGRGTPVCEAYLQRLNQTRFENPPYCGRPESTVVPGFDPLNRRWLDRIEYTHLLPRVESFLENRPIEDFYVHHKGPDGKDVFGPPLDDFLPKDFLPVAWSYDPPVDIENRGIPDQVVIWSDADRNDFSRCLQYIGPHATADRAAEWGAVLSSDQGNIDGQRTNAVFGHPDGGFWIPTGPQGKGPPHLRTGFRPMGVEVGIFRYRGVTYFDTFFTHYELGDLHNARRNNRRLRDTLGVFVHRNQHTQQVCEYYVSDQGD